MNNSITASNLLTNYCTFPSVLRETQHYMNSQQAYPPHAPLHQLDETTEKEACETLVSFTEQVHELDRGNYHTLGIPDYQVSNFARSFFECVLIQARYETINCSQIMQANNSSEIKTYDVLPDLDAYTQEYSTQIAYNANLLLKTLGEQDLESNVILELLKDSCLEDLFLLPRGNLLNEKENNLILFSAKTFSKIIQHHPITSSDIQSYFNNYLSSKIITQREGFKGSNFELKLNAVVKDRLNIIFSLSDLVFAHKTNEHAPSPSFPHFASSIAKDLTDEIPNNTEKLYYPPCEVMRAIFTHLIFDNILDLEFSPLNLNKRAITAKDLQEIKQQKEILVPYIETIVSANYPEVLKMCRECAMATCAAESKSITHLENMKVHLLWEKFHTELIFQIQATFFINKLFPEDPSDRSPEITKGHLPSFISTLFWEYVSDTKQEKTKKFFTISALLTRTLGEKDSKNTKTQGRKKKA